MKIRRYIAAFLIICLTLIFPVKGYAIEESGRIAGDDRYETSVKISISGWTDGSSQYAVIATGEDYPDALCAAPLAKKLNAPILLTSKSKLDSRIEAELTRLGVKDVYIIGGAGVISPEVEQYIKSKGMKTVRVWGSSRYETSIEVAKLFGEVNEVVIATGDNFPDALSIAPVAAKKLIPIILTSKDTLPESVRGYLKGKTINKSYIVGGTGVISENAASGLQNPLRLQGKDRYETNAAVLNAFSNDLNFSTSYAATGEDYPDALSGSALAAKTSSPVVLIGKGPMGNTSDFISGKLSTIGKIRVLGGEGAVSTSSVIQVFGYNKNHYTLVKEGKYEYIQTITIRNNGTTPLHDVSFQVDIGVLNGSPYQRGETVDVVGQDIKLVSEFPGKVKATAKISSIEKGQSVEYKVVRTFNNSGIKYTADLSLTSGDYSGFSSYLKYTSPEDKIENDNISIKNKTTEIVKGEKNPYKKAQKIFEFVNTYIDYDLSQANKGALNALTTKKGVCEDYADLFIAMARAAGVPARLVTGYADETQSFSGTIDVSDKGHAWAEFYLPEYGWIVAEPTVIKYDAYKKRVPAYNFFANLEGPGHFIQGYSNDFAYEVKYYSSNNKPNISMTQHIRKIN